MKSVKRLILFLFLIGFVSQAQLAGQEWELTTTVDKIKVYTRLTNRSAIKEVRVTSFLNAPSLNHLANALGDVNTYKQWVPNCVEAKLIEKRSSSEIIYYNRTKFPWPLKDRDFLVFRKVWQDSLDYSFKAKTQSHISQAKPIKGAVRVIVIESSWKITPKGNGSFETTLTLLCDPAGNVPKWFTNEVVDVGPIRTFKKLESVVNNKTYNFGLTQTFKELPESSKLNSVTIKL